MSFPEHALASVVLQFGQELPKVRGRLERPIGVERLKGDKAFYGVIPFVREIRFLPRLREQQRREKSVYSSDRELVVVSRACEMDTERFQSFLCGWRQSEVITRRVRGTSTQKGYDEVGDRVAIVLHRIRDPDGHPGCCSSDIL